MVGRLWSTCIIYTYLTPCIVGEFCKAIEEDARERAERKKEREKRGKELKIKGTQAFRREEFESAADLYSQAMKESPWDISLYTNMALVCL